MNGYKLLPAQIKFLRVEPDVDQDFCFYQGGFGSGKTFIGSYAGIRLARLYPGSLGLAVARTNDLLKETTLRTYFEHFDNLGWKEGRHYRWVESKNKMLFPQWGSEILFRHLEKPWKLKSLNLAWVHMEEASEISEASFDMLISRLRQSGIKRYRLFGTTNPQANKGWIHKRFVENGGKHVIDIDGQQVVLHYRRIIAPSTENIHLSKANLANMKLQYDPEYYNINVLGQDGDYTAGLVVKEWSELNEIETTFQEGLPLYITCDFNVDPMCWLLVQRYNREYHYIEELIREHTTTTECIEWFAEKYPPEMARDIIITGDASGNARSTQAKKANDTNYKIMANRLSELGYKKVRIDVREKNPPVGARIAAFNAMVCSKDGVRRVFMNPKTCPRTIYNNRNLKFIEGTSEIYKPSPHDIKLDKSLKFLVHPFDAESYIVEKNDPIQRVMHGLKDEQPPEIMFDV